MESNDQVLQILNVVLGIMLFVLVFLVIILVAVKVREKSEEKKKKKDNEEEKKEVKNVEDYKKESILDFMDFDAIEDSMIIRKDWKRYVMVIKCTGTNYDLASEDEKLAIESGFLKVLNSLKFPIQIYIQTRKFNIDSSILEYKERLKKLAMDAERQNSEYEIVRRNPNSTEKQIRDAYKNLQRANNIYDYTRDVIKNTEQIKTNRNILKREHFILLSYSPLEDVSSDEKYDKEELKDKAFSELYTRCQSLIRVLGSCDVSARIINSTEVAELLYVAYNKEQYEIYGIDKILNSNYDQLYVTAQDVMDKKIRRLDSKIEAMAGRKANDLIDKVMSEKEKKIKDREENMDAVVREMTRMIIEQNENLIGVDVAEKATELLNEEGEKQNENRKKE